MVSKDAHKEVEQCRRGRTVAHDEGGLLVDSLLCHGWAQVVGEEDSLVVRGGLQTELSLARRVEVPQKQANVVPSPVSNLFRVPVTGLSAQYIRMPGGAAAQG